MSSFRNKSCWSIVSTVTYEQVEQRHKDEQNRSRRNSLSELDSKIQQCLDNAPEGPILDFLIKYFVREVNW